MRQIWGKTLMTYLGCVSKLSLKTPFVRRVVEEQMYLVRHSDSPHFWEMSDD